VFMVWGLWFGFYWGLRFGVWCEVFKVSGLVFRVEGLGSRVWVYGS